MEKPTNEIQQMTPFQRAALAINDLKSEIEVLQSRCGLLEEEVRLLRDQRKELLDRFSPKYPELQDINDEEVLSHFEKGEPLDGLIERLARPEG